MSQNPERWYQAGLSFECSTCGNCCSGPTGTVFFDEAEGRAMAERRGLSEAEFYADCAEVVDGRWSLTEIRTSRKNYDCVFLDRKTKPGQALCQVYGARPSQCRTWPFWPENLESRKSWYWVKRNTPCPGMDHGRQYSLSEIERRRDSE